MGRTKPPILWGPAVNRSERDVHHSTPSITMVKWSYAFIPLYDFKASTGTTLPLPKLRNVYSGIVSEYKLL